MIKCVKKLTAALLLAVMVLSLVPVTASAEQVFEGEDKIVVVIDPGHGGYDPGASRNGVTEETWTLAVAKELNYSIKVEIQDPPPEWNKNVYL